MSSKSRKMKKQVSDKTKFAFYEAENSLLGSIIISCAKLGGIKEEKAVWEFQRMKNNLHKQDWYCVKDIVDYYTKKYKAEESKDLLIMVLDSKEVYTPLVTILYEDTILPIAETGIASGILLAIEGDENERYTFEKIYDTDS